jgi:predicted adenine nucleotide alpha hydrolase (AANH) superfamily ATPase
LLGTEIVENYLKNQSADEEKKVPKWLVSDFKKKGGFKRSLEISQEFNLYRQQYCGCVYSKVNKENYEK